MNNYFFANHGYGRCFTVIAESEEEAIAKVKVYLRSGEKSYNLLEKNEIATCLLDVDDGERKDKFSIHEFKSEEVIETEYA